MVNNHPVIIVSRSAVRDYVESQLRIGPFIMSRSIRPGQPALWRKSSNARVSNDPAMLGIESVCAHRLTHLVSLHPSQTAPDTVLSPSDYVRACSFEPRLHGYYTRGVYTANTVRISYF